MKKRILFLNKDGVLGGSAVSLFLLLKEILNEYDIRVICCQKGPFFEKLQSLSIPVHFLPFKNWRQLKYIFLNLAAVLKLKYFLYKYKTEIIHSNSYEINPLMVLAAGRRVRTICHVRDSITDKKAKKFLLQKAGRIIAISHSVKKALASLKEKIKVIYNGVDLREAEYVGDEFKYFFKRIKSGFRIGIIGNCEKRKRQEDFIKAGLLLCREKPDCQFFIIGNSDNLYGRKIKEMVLFSQQNFHFIQHVEKILSLIKYLDIIVITSLEEAFGRTAVEAMAMKKAVIGTKVGGIPEIIKPGQTGFLYKAGDYVSLMKHMLFCYNHRPVIKNYGQNGFQRVKALFTIEGHAAAVQRIYDND